MVELTSTSPSDSTRQLSSLHLGVLPQVTSANVLMELRGQYGARFTPSVGNWSEIGLDHDRNVLYKLTSKSAVAYYFTVKEGKVCRLARVS